MANDFGVRISISSPNESTLREIIANLDKYTEWTISKISYTDCPEDYEGNPQHWLDYKVVYYILRIYAESIDTCDFDGFDSLHTESLPENYVAYGTPRLQIDVVDYTKEFYEDFDEIRKNGTIVDSSLGS